MNIAIIGAGNIGRTLGLAWLKAGHAVKFGVRQPADPKLDDLRPTAPVQTVAEALAEADVVVLAVPGGAVAQFAAEHGAALAGKVVVDATNNVRGADMNNLAPLRAHAPQAALVRAFSTLGWENFANPQLADQTVDLFFTAAPAIRATAETLIRAVGLNPIYVGDLEATPLVDGLTRLWFALAFNQGYGRRVALKVLHEV